MLPVNEKPYRIVGAAIGTGPGAREDARGWGGAAATFVACTVTLRSRGRSSVVGAGVTVPRRISSVITLMSAVGSAAAPTGYLFFPCLEYRAVTIMCGELGIEKGEDIHEGGRAPSKAMFSRPAITAAAAILYTSLTAGVFSKEGCPQGQVGVDHVIYHSTHNRVVSVIEDQEAVIDRERVPAGMCM